MIEFVEYPFRLIVFSMSMCGAVMYSMLIYNMISGPGNPSKRDFLVLLAWKMLCIAIATHFLLRLIK